LTTDFSQFSPFPDRSSGCNRCQRIEEMDEPSPSDLDALAMTERELFSLYARYPEITFESECTERLPECVEHFSSPRSNTEDVNDDSFQASSSTRHTTPLRHDLSNSSNDEYTAFNRQLRDCDLPQASVQYFNSLEVRFVQIGRYLNHDDAESPEFILQVSDLLVKQMRDSANSVNEQIHTISWVAELAPFNILPTDVALWSNYQQRASLVSK
jgi:hypothetical protein